MIICVLNIMIFIIINIRNTIIFIIKNMHLGSVDPLGIGDLCGWVCRPCREEKWKKIIIIIVVVVIVIINN